MYKWKSFYSDWLKPILSGGFENIFVSRAHKSNYFMCDPDLENKQCTFDL